MLLLKQVLLPIIDKAFSLLDKLTSQSLPYSTKVSSAVFTKKITSISKSNLFKEVLPAVVKVFALISNLFRCIINLLLLQHSMLMTFIVPKDNQSQRTFRMTSPHAPFNFSSLCKINVNLDMSFRIASNSPEDFHSSRAKHWNT